MNNAFPFAVIAAAAVMAALTLTSTHANAEGQVLAQARPPAVSQPADAAPAAGTTERNIIASLSDVVKWTVVDGKLTATWKYPKLPSELWRFEAGDPPLKLVASGKLDHSGKGNFRIVSRGLGKLDNKEGDTNRFSLENDPTDDTVGLTILFWPSGDEPVYMEYVQKPGRPVGYLRVVRRDNKDIRTRVEAEDFARLQEKLAEVDKAALASMLALLGFKP